MGIFKIIDFFFPNPCLVCEKIDFLSNKTSICKSCYKQNQQLISQKKLCEICKNILNKKKCYFCNSRNVFFDNLEFLYYRDSFQKSLMNSLKFNSNFYASNFYKLGFKRIFSKYLNQIDACIFLPHSKIMRSYNVVEPVAKKIANYLSVPIICPFIKKVKSRQSSNSAVERYFYAQTAFELKANFQHSNKNYLLVDDIFTTGATINEVSKILKQHCAKSVHIFVFLKTEI